MRLENASWQKVQGPAGAVYCTLKRLRWGMVSWDSWVTDDGIRINPWGFGKRAFRSMIDASAQRSLVQGLGGPDGKVE
eukprot:2565185-Pyramimonas_sp.AAC.1